VPVYLSDTIRSRSFSLPQRFEPARASWLCFTPHPPTGFWPSEPFPLGQPGHLPMLVALMPFRSASRPETSELCSGRESVLGRPRLGERSSRCSHDLFPLRGVPTQPLGLRPPLMCLFIRAARRPKTPAAWGHGTSGYRSGWAWEPLRRPAPTSLRSATFRSPATIDHLGRTRGCREEPARASACRFLGLLGCHSL
jgi:hypothetical protein